MPTTKKRINITLSPAMEASLEELAKYDSLPIATKAQQLLQMAIELEEDKYFSTLVDERVSKDTKFVSHEEAWS